MDSWNDTENTELTGEITEGYFSEGSGNVRDAPKRKYPGKKYEQNYVDTLSPSAYADIYTGIEISEKITSLLNTTSPST